MLLPEKTLTRFSETSISTWVSWVAMAQTGKDVVPAKSIMAVIVLNNTVFIILSPFLIYQYPRIMGDLS